MNLIDNIYSLRQKFIIIGLTGRTGSGCTTVAEMLCKKSLNELPSDYPFSSPSRSNDDRKHRIIYDFLSNHWDAFTAIKASDVIFFYALLEDFETFQNCFIIAGEKMGEDKAGTKENNDRIRSALEILHENYKRLHETAIECNSFIEYNIPDIRSKEEFEKYDKYRKLLLNEIPLFRKTLSEALLKIDKRIMSRELQKWGTNIRLYNSIHPSSKNQDKDEAAPACLAEKINKFSKLIRRLQKYQGHAELIVIDALRNPFEVLYFKERYSAFYSMSVNTTESVRHNSLHKAGYTNKEIAELENAEKSKNEVSESFSGIDVDRCIELSDIHITHDGTKASQNKSLVLQLITYLALIKHPGLVPPSPQERLMQIAYTARLNSGCLSRQVGAAVTDKNFSLKSIGWNTVPCGQVPCSLRSLLDLHRVKDDKSFSNYERDNDEFRERIATMVNDYQKKDRETESSRIEKLKGLNLSYCFKDVFTDIHYKKEAGNQVHTRSLHAEENAFLQLAKYGSEGIEGGYLFTTASCCELCGKKAYQLGIRRIYYIDTYPGITKQHILECGTNIPKLILFNGAIGRAYISLYSPILPQKDEIEEITGLSVKYNKQQTKSQPALQTIKEKPAKAPEIEVNNDLEEKKEEVKDGDNNQD